MIGCRNVSVKASEASKTTCHEGQRGLKKLGETGICVAAVTALLTRHRERHKYIIPLPLPDDIDGREDRVCKVRLQRQLDTEVSGACRRKLGRQGRYGAAIPTSLARRHREWYKYMV
ncbi:hypothetical protein MRX96_001560 [Rhipicephalus microplus]